MWLLHGPGISVTKYYVFKFVELIARNRTQSQIADEFSPAQSMNPSIVKVRVEEKLDGSEIKSESYSSNLGYGTIYNELQSIFVIRIVYF